MTSNSPDADISYGTEFSHNAGPPHLTSSPFIEAPLEELAALYAAGALTHAERSEVEQRLNDGDEPLWEAVRSWDVVVAALGTALEPATPDPRIKAALLTRLSSEEVDLQVMPPTVRVSDRTPPPRIVHRADGSEWRSAGASGASIRVLNADRKRGRMTTLMKIEPGCRFPAHPHSGDEECLVLSGDMIDGDLTLGPGDYVRSAAGTHHEELTTRTGCVCLVLSSLEPQAAR